LVGGDTRLCEHIATLLFPWLAILFIPLRSARQKLFGWMAVGLR
jgi:hypothetical protein